MSKILVALFTHEVVFGAGRGDLIEVVHGRRAETFEDERQLVVVVAAGEQGLAVD